MIVPTLENRLQFVVNLRERGGACLERLVLDQTKTRQQGTRFAVIRTRSLVLGLVAHAHEYSSLGTVSA